MEEFLPRLKDISDGLKKVVESETGELGIHITSTFVPGLSLDRDTIRQIADLGLSMDIDVVIHSSDDD